jgi:hypothetical protein
MKKYISLLSVSLTLAFASQAQQSQTNGTVTAQSLKLQAQTRMAYNSTTGGNEFTTSLVTRVNPALNMTAPQQKSMNMALYNFFNQKGALAKLKWSDHAAYVQQVNSLLQTFIGQLGNFLSTDQVNKFVAMKPATAQTRDPLVSVFY